MIVITRGPHTFISLQHHAVVSPRSYCNRITTDPDKIGFVGFRSIPKLTIIVPTRGPHAAIALQHHAVAIPRSHRGCVSEDKHKDFFRRCVSDYR